MEPILFFGEETTTQLFINNCTKAGIYLKGLHGLPTKLTPQQWIWVRTSSFKDTYGDWENWYKCKFLLDAKPVSALNGTEFEPILGKTLTEQVSEYFLKLGGIAYSPYFGDVILDKKGADDSLAHGMGRKKAIAYAAVKDVIEKGILIDYDFNHKGRNYNSAVISAPIIIKEERFICSVVITKMQDNRFYLHEIKEQKKLSNEGSNTVQRQPQRSKAFAKILQNILAAKNFIINLPLDENGEPRLSSTI